MRWKQWLKEVVGTYTKQVKKGAAKNSLHVILT
jgi:hypothetical protein